MATYTWPGFTVDHFELRLKPNLRNFVGPYTPAVQSVDLLGERWAAKVTITLTSDAVEGGAREAFWDRLRGQVNSVALWHLKRPQPAGTMRGSVAAGWRTGGGSAAVWSGSGGTAVWQAGDPVVHQAIPQLAGTGTIRMLPGKTLLAGDHINLGGAQLVRCMANAVADSAGLAEVEFQPRARQTIPANTAVLWDHPTATFILAPGTDGVPTAYRPGVIDGASVDLIETF